jgi:iron complex transport system permease protein
MSGRETKKTAGPGGAAPPAPPAAAQAGAAGGAGARNAAAFTALACLLLAAFAANLCLGSVSIPIDSILRILTGRPPGRASWASIVLLIRLPKALTALLAGSALAVAGLLMQTLFRNPLAGPFVLGIGSGASLGVALVVLLAGGSAGAFFAAAGLLGDAGIVAAAALGAAGVMALVLAASRRIQNVMTLLILGLLFGYAAGAGVNVLIYLSSAERIQAYISWTFGTFGGTTWSQMRVLAPLVLLGLAGALLARKQLNALLLGEAYARSMGLAVRRARIVLLIITSLLTAVVTAFCGPIAFLGVAIPHLCRSLLSSSDHRLLLPGCALLGGATALLADLAAQLPGSQAVLPLNAVTSLIGAPVIIAVVLSKRNLSRSFSA